jgi:hypothetical protein
MSSLAHQSKYRGGVCYAACQDLFNWFNPSTHHCRRGCDFGTGRVNNPAERIEADDMCKRYASELYSTNKFEMGKIRLPSQLKVKDENINFLRQHKRPQSSC